MDFSAADAYSTKVRLGNHLDFCQDGIQVVEALLVDGLLTRHSTHPPRFVPILLILEIILRLLLSSFSLR